MFLKIENVSVSYGGVQALLGISLETREGEIVCILGGNGAGKTTLVNAICGFVEPLSGDIIFRDRKINGLLPHDIVKLGIIQVPEGRGIFSPLSVLENLKAGGYLAKSKEIMEKRFAQIYEFFPILRERRNQTGGSLSGGEQQMLAIGRGLMANPQLLLMDEPTLGLSPLMRRELMNVTGKINHSGTSIILVEQNARMALRAAHRAVIIQNGQIVLEGASGELLNNPSLRESYLA